MKMGFIVVLGAMVLTGCSTTSLDAPSLHMINLRISAIENKVDSRLKDMENIEQEIRTIIKESQETNSRSVNEEYSKLIRLLDERSVAFEQLQKDFEKFKAEAEENRQRRVNDAKERNPREYNEYLKLKKLFE